MALGNNMDSIFDEVLDAANPNEEIIRVSINEIEPNRNQPRRNFDDDGLTSLSESIKEHGIIQPITVKALETGGYQIIAGERRWRAARIAGLSEAPVRVMNLTDEEVVEVALVENLQREDLNPIEEANGIKALIEGFGLTHEEAAKKLGRARSTISNALRLLEAPFEIRELVHEGKLGKGQTKAIISANDSELAVKIAREAADKGLTVVEIERRINPSKPVKTKEAPTNVPEPDRKPMPRTHYEPPITEVLAEETEPLTETKTDYNPLIKEAEKQLSSADYISEARIAWEEFLKTPARIISNGDKIMFAVEFANLTDFKNFTKEIISR